MRPVGDGALGALVPKAADAGPCVRAVPREPALDGLLCLAVLFGGRPQEERVLPEENGSQDKEERAPHFGGGVTAQDNEDAREEEVGQADDVQADKAGDDQRKDDHLVPKEPKGVRSIVRADDQEVVGPRVGLWVVQVVLVRDGEDKERAGPVPGSHALLGQEKVHEPLRVVLEEDGSHDAQLRAQDGGQRLAVLELDKPEPPGLLRPPRGEVERVDEKRQLEHHVCQRVERGPHEERAVDDLGGGRKEEDQEEKEKVHGRAELDVAKDDHKERDHGDLVCMENEDAGDEPGDGGDKGREGKERERPRGQGDVAAPLGQGRGAEKLAELRHQDGQDERVPNHGFDAVPDDRGGGVWVVAEPGNPGLCAEGRDKRVDVVSKVGKLVEVHSDDHQSGVDHEEDPDAADDGVSRPRQLVGDDAGVKEGHKPKRDDRDLGLGDRDRDNGRIRDPHSVPRKQRRDLERQLCPERRGGRAHGDQRGGFIRVVGG